MSSSTANLVNSLNQSLDTIFSRTGSPIGKLKLALGSKSVAGDTDTAAYQGVATHIVGDTFASGDGVMAVSGVAADGTTMKPMLVDTTGRVAIGDRGSLTDAANLDLDVAATSQSLFAANVARKFLLIQNLDAAEDLWVNFGAAATIDKPSIKIAAGQILRFDGNFIPTQSVTVIATTINHKYTAKEG